MQDQAQSGSLLQYLDLRQRALARALDAADVHAYIDARRDVTAAVLQQQRIGMADGHRLRGQARALVHLPITLHLGDWETDTFINDLSQGGCSMFLSRKPALEYIPFDLYLSTGVTIQGHADVVATRQRGEGVHVSLRFRPLSNEARALIEDTVLQALVGR